jgi:hypothetical protein
MIDIWYRGTDTSGSGAQTHMVQGHTEIKKTKSYVHASRKCVVTCSTSLFFCVKGPAADATDAPQPYGLLCNPVMKIKDDQVFHFYK